MKAVFLIMSCVALLCACATDTTFDRAVTPVPTGSDCRVDLYADKNIKPSRPYVLVTKAQSHIQRNIFFGGKASPDDAYTELRKQACSLKADAVIVDDYVASTAAEFSHIYVWASLVRYNDLIH